MMRAQGGGGGETESEKHRQRRFWAVVGGGRGRGVGAHLCRRPRRVLTRDSAWKAESRRSPGVSCKRSRCLRHANAEGLAAPGLPRRGGEASGGYNGELRRVCQRTGGSMCSRNELRTSSWNGFPSLVNDRSADGASAQMRLRLISSSCDGADADVHLRQRLPEALAERARHDVGDVSVRLA